MKEPKERGGTTIVQSGDPVLRAVAAKVDPKDIGTKKLNDILQRMKIALEREGDGVAGLGVRRRVEVHERIHCQADETASPGPALAALAEPALFQHRLREGDCACACA